MTAGIYQNGTSDEFHHHYSYDNGGRLTQVQTSNNGSLKTTHARYYYYLHGPLKRTELRQLQGVDFIYTIQGWLKSINNPELDPGADGINRLHDKFGEDIFSEALDYFSGDYTRLGTTVQNNVSTTNVSISGHDDHFNGLVKSQRWKCGSIGNLPGINLQGNFMYAYAYDQFGQISSGQYGTVSAGTQNSLPSISQPALFTGDSKYLVEGITYDRNGNLLTLQRSGSGTLQMDNLLYNYELDGNGNRINNKLMSLDDSYNKPYTTDIGSDIFEYDIAGRLIQQQENDQTFEYNVDGKVTLIKRDGKKVTSFAYDEFGNKILKVVYDSGQEPTSITDYYYDVQGVLLRTVETPDVGTSQKITETNIYGAGRIGHIHSDLPVAIYEMKDHIGNVRATFSLNPNTKNLYLHSYTDYYPHGSVMPDRFYSSSPIYKYAYQGQEEDAQTGYLNFDLRMYDARLGRWFNADPMEQYFSGYLAMGNNPVSSIDPDGGWDYAGPDGGDPNSPEYAFAVFKLNRMSYYNWYDRRQMMLESGTSVTFTRFLETIEDHDGELVTMSAWGKENLEQLIYERLTGNTNIVNLRDHNVEDVHRLVPKKIAYWQQHYAQSGGGVNWNDINTGLKIVEGFGVAAAAGREIALDYRMSQPLMNRVGMSANVKAIFDLGMASKYLGAAGYLGALVGTVLDINAYRNGQLSGARLSYNTLGTAVATGVGIGVSAVPGAAAGGVFYVGQQFYDGYNWWVGQMSIYLTNFENGLKIGWVPGR